jgi:hypothetical protein
MAGSALEPHRTKVNLEFTDGNKVTYFEKLLMRKYKDGTITAHSGVPYPVPTETAFNEEEFERVPAISKYNLFYYSEDEYDGDDMLVETYTNGVSEPFTYASLATAVNSTGPPSISIEELISNGEENPEILAHPEEEAKKDGSNYKRMAGAQNNHTEVTETGNGSSQRKNRGKNRRARNGKGKEKQVVFSHGDKQKENEQPSSSHVEEKVLPPTIEHGHRVPHLKESDLLASVRSAWDNCTEYHHSNKQLGNFFLHGVQPAGSEEDEAMLVNIPQDLSPSDFKLASTVWLPSSSTVQCDPEVAYDSSESPTIPLSRPGTRDCYYDDTDSDSEPENEREEFIQSRMGMAPDSVGCIVSRPATSTSLRDLEVEDPTERDRDDCETLDELACELASTVECEGRLTRCRDLDESEGEYDVATPVPAACEGGLALGMPDGEVIDMSEVISDFELYQKRLMEEDSDQEQ